jgi:hypothetical protein
VLLNSALLTLGGSSFDPYPFMFLNLILSMQCQECPRSAEGGYLIGKMIADTAPLLEGLIHVTGDSMSVHNPRNYLPLADGQLADSAVEKLLRQLADLLVHGAPQPRMKAEQRKSRTDA